MNVGAFLIAHTEAPALMQPTMCPFDHPAETPQTAAVRCVATGQMRLDTSLSQLLTMRLRIIRTVSVDGVWTMTRPTRFAVNGRYRVDQWDYLGHIVAVRARDGRRQWNASRFCDDVMLGAGLPPICRIRPGLRPPKTARTLELSMMARDQSIWSALFRRSSNTRWRVSHTPAIVQSRSRLQQVIPQPQPISWGRSSQGMPVLSTKRMPVMVSRWPTGLRPGYRNRRRGNGGMNDSRMSHCSSVRRGLATITPPCICVVANLRFVSLHEYRRSHSQIFHYVRAS